MAEIAAQHITKSELISNLGYRKKQLEVFKGLLEDDGFFQSKTKEWGVSGKEATWQRFFENNPWIFGYGLSYVFTSPLDEKKLEQVTTGYSFAQSGKRTDALLKTRGYISTFCFVEIKTHKTPLLHREPEPYRAESWRISEELAGSVAQIQKTIQKALQGIHTKVEMQDSQGKPTGEVVFISRRPLS